jgi:hypothetical protein
MERAISIEETITQQLVEMEWWAWSIMLILIALVANIYTPICQQYSLMAMVPCFKTKSIIRCESGQIYKKTAFLPMSILILTVSI